MRTVIMAGGKGRRLYPYTACLPKPLVPMGDRPIKNCSLVPARAGWAPLLGPQLGEQLARLPLLAEDPLRASNAPDRPRAPCPISSPSRTAPNMTRAFIYFNFQDERRRPET